MAIVTVDELQDYMSDVTLTAAQLAAAAMVINGVQSELETYLNRPVERVERTETVYPAADGTLYVAATPIESVTSVTHGGNAVDHTFANGLITLSGTAMPGIGYTVTYVGGLDGTTIHALRSFVLRVAAREMENRHDDTLSVKDLSARDTSPLEEGPQDDDFARVQRYRRRVVV